MPSTTPHRAATPSPAPGTTRLGDAQANFHLVEDPGGLVPVDGGLPGHLPQLRSCLESAGRSLGDIHAVLLTPMTVYRNVRNGQPAGTGAPRHKPLEIPRRLAPKVTCKGYGIPSWREFSSRAHAHPCPAPGDPFDPRPDGGLAPRI